MRRRQFITLLGGAALWPRLARAKEPVRHIIALFPLGTDDPVQMTQRVTLRLMLENIGWTDGRLARMEYHHAKDANDFARLAREAVAKKPDMIFAQSDGLAAAIARETRTVPVVFADVFDPVGAGLVASLKQPSGNITGVALFDTSVVGKWLSMLKEVSPGIKRVVLVGNPQAPSYEYFLRAAEAAAPKLALAIVPGHIGAADAIEDATASVAAAPQGGLVVAPDQTMKLLRARIIALAARQRLPAVYPERLYAADGGLMAYGVPDPIEPIKQAAAMIDRILMGQKPGNVAVQMPAKVSLTVNRGAAKALGLTVPHSLLAGAEVIE